MIQCLYVMGEGLKILGPAKKRIIFIGTIEFL